MLEEEIVNVKELYKILNLVYKVDIIGLGIVYSKLLRSDF